MPPDGAQFYPFWSMTNLQGLDGVTTTPASPCVWNFGNDIAGITTNDFGKDAQYGSSGSHFFGTDISAVQSNPAINNGCPNLTLSGVSGGATIAEVPWIPGLVLGGVVVVLAARFRRQLGLKAARG